MKQVVWSVVAVMIAALLLVGMVLYTLSTVYTVKMRILTGEAGDRLHYDYRILTEPSAFADGLFLVLLFRKP